MSTITEYYQQAGLAFAAYADLYSDISENDYKKALIEDAKMTDTQADAFIEKYSVVDQYADASGVSATVFEDNETGKRFLAIRGTDGAGDINADYILAAGFPSYVEFPQKIIMLF